MNKSISLYCCENNSDKVYNISLEEVVNNGFHTNGFKVNFSYGRRGSSLNVGTKTSSPLPFSSAESIFNKLVNEKKAKGYMETGSVSNIPTVVESRDTGVRPQLLNECTEKEVEFYLNDNNWCAEEKFDGENRLLFSGDEPYGANRKGLSIAICKEYETELKKLGN